MHLQNQFAWIYVPRLNQNLWHYFDRAGARIEIEFCPQRSHFIGSERFFVIVPWNVGDKNAFAGATPLSDQKFMGRNGPFDNWLSYFTAAFNPHLTRNLMAHQKTVPTALLSQIWLTKIMKEQILIYNRNYFHKILEKTLLPDLEMLHHINIIQFKTSLKWYY